MTGLDLKSYYANAATIYKFWIGSGFTPEVASGLLAQADAESSLNPAAVGDHGAAFGIDQWHENRARAIKAGCGVDLRATPKPSLSDQLKAALWELKHTEAAALRHVVAAKTAYDAGFAAAKYWERPGAPGQPDKRGKTAEKWAAYFAKNPVV
jgi:hypothetical protein